VADYELEADTDVSISSSPAVLLSGIMIILDRITGAEYFDD